MSDTTENAPDTPDETPSSGRVGLSSDALFDDREVTEIDIAEIAPNLTMFHMKMNALSMPFPCWVKIGNSKIKIHSSEEMKIMNLGMLLMMEAQEYYSSKD